MPDQTSLPAAVFKAYDIRGTVPAQLNERFAYRLGLALAAQIVWTLDPAERDAVLANEEAKKSHPGGRALVEIACARTPAQLFAVKQAYHDRFKRSLEEDVAAHVTGDFRKVKASDLMTI